MSGLDDYQFENKNRWRVMMWHRIAARVKRSGKRLGEAVVIYLPGPQDLDRRIALRKGFSAANLIGVDHSIENVEAMRSSGCLAIHGDLADVLANWSRRVPVDVLFGDFCAGLHDTVSHKVISAIYYTAFADYGVIALNFQRGRDSWSNYLRTAMQRDWSFEQSDGQSITEKAGEEILRRNGIEGDLKHRGRQFCFMFWMLTRCGHHLFSRFQATEPAALADQMLRASRPDFLSYQSGVVMDSLLMTWPLLIGGGEYVPRTNLTELRDDALSRQISAVLAHRTMRRAA